MNRLKRLRTYPLSVFLQILLERLTFQAVQIRSFYLLQYAGIPDVSRPRGPGVIRGGEPSDVGQMGQLEQSGKEEIFRERFSRGERCAVAVHQGNIIGYEWYSFTSCHHEQRYLFPVSIPDDAIFAYDAFIKPEFRISGIWIKFKMHLGEKMAASGRKRVITMIDSGNKMSMNTHIRFGFTVYKHIVLFKLAGNRFFRERTIPKCAYSR